MTRLEWAVWAAVVGLPALLVIAYGSLRLALQGAPHRMVRSPEQYSTDGGVDDE